MNSMVAEEDAIYDLGSICRDAMPYRDHSLYFSFIVTLSTIVPGCANSRQVVLEPAPTQTNQLAALSASPKSMVNPKPTFDGALLVDQVTQSDVIDLVNFDDQFSESTAQDIVQTGVQVEDLTLEVIEQLALANNPSIQQLSASASKAVAVRDQVSTKPNPTVGYQASQLADQSTDQHVFFLEQEIVRGDKLALNWSVLNQAAHAQLWEVEAQRLRVLTDVRTRFYEVVAAQQKLAATKKFIDIARQGVELAQRRQDAGETSKVEVLQAKIQFNEVELAIQEIEANYRGAWKSLVAMAGVPSMEPRNVSGQFTTHETGYNWDETYSELIGKSPELSAARTRVTEAQAMLCRQEAQPVSNLFMQLGAGYDNSTDSGMLNIQIGAPIPVFNDNRGNISAAHAEYFRAAHEVQRIEMALKSRLAEASKDYEASLAAVKKLRNEILPDAEEMLTLSEQAYSAGELDFLQVLIVRKTFFYAKIRFIQVENELAQADAIITGLLLTGGLNVSAEFEGDDGLRGQSLGGQ